MKNSYKILVVIIAFSLSLLSCKKEMMDYIGTDGVYFSVQPKTLTGYGDPDLWPVVDSSAVQFAKTKSMDSIYMVKVKLIGYVKNYDRIFGLKVVESSSAVEGRDYDKLPTSITMPAGATFVNIPISFHRTEEMKEDNLRLILDLIATNDLYVPMHRYYTSSSQQSDTVVVNRHKIIVNDRFYKPITWNDYQGGAYSDAKMKLICDLYNVTIDQFDDAKTMPSKRFVTLILSLKNYLAMRKDEGNPVYETDSKGNIIYITRPNGDKEPLEMAVGTVSLS